VTPIPLNPAGQQLTAFVCGVNHLEGNSSGDYNNWVGQSVTADMDTPGAQHPNDDAVVLNYDGMRLSGQPLRSQRHMQIAAGVVLSASNRSEVIKIAWHTFASEDAPKRYLPGWRGGIS